MTEATPWRIKWRADPRGHGGFVRGDLTASGLDPVLHPDGVARVEVARDGIVSVSNTGRETAVTLSPFVLESVSAYVLGQAGVRQAIEAALAEEWPADGGSAAGGVWAHAKIAGVSFAPLDVPTPQRLAKLKESIYRARYSLTELAAMHDTPATRSKFFVELEIDWDEEHCGRCASFRDGMLHDLGQ